MNCESLPEEVRGEVSSSVWCVVVTYNGAEWIEACLASLRASSARPRIVVVDNASKDATVERIRLSFPEVHLRVCGANKGFGVANNIGMSVALDAGADHVFLLNQDATVPADTIPTLVRVAAANPAFGILSPVHLDYGGEFLDARFAGYVLASNPGFFADLFFGRRSVVYDVPFVPAACWLVRSSALRDVGGFDPVFLMYGEDNDLCRRMRARGWRIGVVPGGVVHHWHSLAMKGPEESWSTWSTYYAEIVSRALDDERPLMKTIVRMAGGHAIRLLHNLATWRLSNVRAMWRAWVRVLGALGRVRRHRRLTGRGTGLFLGKPRR